MNLFIFVLDFIMFVIVIAMIVMKSTSDVCDSSSDFTECVDGIRHPMKNFGHGLEILANNCTCVVSVENHHVSSDSFI